MVASFMPSMAFAATPHTDVYPTTPTKWSDVETLLKGADAKYVEVVKTPEHNDAKGEVILHCKADYCDATKKVDVTNDVHEKFIEKDLELGEYADAMVAQKTGGADFKNATAAANWVKTQSATKCYCKNVEVCATCGYVVPDDYLVDHVGQKYACADYTCTKCQKTVKGTGIHNFVKIENAKKLSDPDCGHGTGYEGKCECGATGVAYVGATNGLAHNYGTPVKASEATLDNADHTRYIIKTGYVAIHNTDSAKVFNHNSKGDVDHSLDKAKIEGYTFYKLNNVAREQKGCTVGKQMNLVCETCKTAYPSANASETFAFGHDYVETKVDATCDLGSYTKKECKVCGDVQTTTPASDEKAHAYKATRVAATCTTPEYYLVECTTCSKDCAHSKGVKIANDGTVTNVKTNATVAGVTEWKSTDAVAKTKTFIFKGFGGELKGTDVIEVTFDTSLGTPDHKPGVESVIKEATCDTDAVYGKKCTVCGKLIAGSAYSKDNTALGHNFVKAEVAPTCGVAGYSYEQCSVCNVYKKGATTDTDIEATGVKTTIKPIVKAGEACTFDKWVVVKEATVFEKGVESLECSVCGAVDSKASIAKKTVAKASNTVKAGKKSFNVKSSAANATGYRVYYKKAGAKSWKSYTKKTASLSKTFSGLSKGKYYVKVKAYAKNYAGDGEVVWGAYSATKTVKVK